MDAASDETEDIGGGLIEPLRVVHNADEGLLIGDRLMVEVGTYATRSDAEVAQAALVAAGIASRLRADDAGGAYPFDLTNGAHLLVDEADVELAAEILGTHGTHTGGSAD